MAQKRAGGVATGVDLEFRSQYHKKKETERIRKDSNILTSFNLETPKMNKGEKK